MESLRLLADDLTGALDSAARFVPAFGAITVCWLPGSRAGALAVDSGTRDLTEALAAARIEEFAPVLGGGEPAFKKIDSLLRGHVALELAACMHAFDHCVLAPAFPFQGRITQRGRQFARSGEEWRETGIDLEAELRRHGISVAVQDAESDGDLDRIVARGRALPGRVLWCGTGGLAGALAGRCPVPRPALIPPVLALVGSNHAMSKAQVAAVAPERRGSVVTCELPDGTERGEARRQIADRFAALLHGAERPGTLFVSGGETLHDLCENLGVTHLEVDGELAPGVPTSLMRGGVWDGQRLVSKSGAFGDRQFLTKLLEDVR
jgi:D-threonate/D-erythronate kinase